MPQFRSRISLDHLHCYTQPEHSGGEPYLWTAFFKIDGDTIVVDVDAQGIFLNGPCTFVAGTSSHGNLGDTDVHEGDDVLIPAALGQTEFTVSTFRKAERLGSDDTNERGAVGVVVALIEEEALTDSDVARGRARFNKEVENGINRVIRTLRIETNFEPQSGDVAALKERVADAVKSAVIDGVRSFLRAFFAGDKEIATDFFLASETKEIDERLQRKEFRDVQDVPPPQPPHVQEIITHDYGLVGKINWFEAAPIYWHHDQTGETQIWFMNEHQLVRRATVLGEDGQPALIGPPFRIVGVGDMDADGKADIIWHHDQTGETQIWFMNEHQLVRRATVLGEDGQPALIGPPFAIVGVGDMDADGKADIIWHHDQTGETQIWFMNEHQLVRRATVLGEDGQPALIGPPFAIVGVGDMDADGKADIIWHHDQTGETQIWFMNEHQLVRRATVLGEDGQPALIGPPFAIVGVGDMDADGKADIIWHHDQTGETQIWFMNEHQLVRRATVLGEDGQPALIGPPFRIVGVAASRG